MQTIANGRWHHAGVTSWSGQTVFQSEMVKNVNSIDCAPFDFQDVNGRMPNLVNELNDAVLLNATFEASEIAAIPDLGDTFKVGSGSIDVTTNAAIVHFAGVGTISAQANGGSGLVNHTDTGHTLKVGEIVEITGTTSYNGTFGVKNVYVDSFDLEQTWVANDTAGQWRRGYHPFPDKGYIFTRITYTRGEVAADKFIFGINKEGQFGLRILFASKVWQIKNDSSTFNFEKLLAQSNSEVSVLDGEYCFLLAVDNSVVPVSLLVYDI